MVVNQIMVDNYVSRIEGRWVVLRLSDSSLLNLFPMVDDVVVGPIVVLFVVFLCSGFRSTLSPLLCFIAFFYHDLFNYDVFHR